MKTPLEVISSYPAHAGTLWSFVESRAQAIGDSDFLVYAGKSISYCEFARAVERASAMFASRGVRSGDRIGVMLENHPCIAISFIALARIGAIMVPVNPTFKVEEARRLFAHAMVSGVLCSPAVINVVRPACAGLAPVPWILLSEPGEAQLPEFERELGRAPALPPDPVGEADRTCVLIYTSGTTGVPKGVMHSQRNVVVAGEAFVERMYLQPDERMLCILPMFHINALFYSFSGAIAAGATLVLEPRFSASTFWKTVAENRVTQTNAIAAISNILIKRPREEFVPAHRLRKIYAAPCSLEAYRVFQGEFGVPTLIEGYGMSEIPGVLNNPFLGPHKQGSMGPPSMHPDRGTKFAEMRVADDEGRFLGDNETGELVVRTRILMQGYYRSPEQTAAAFRDGWFLTGDLGYRDPDGYFWFVARKMDIIRRRGENISGAELDRVIGEHPQVQEAAAIPVPSELGEDDILVAVIARPGASVSAQEIASWCRERLAPLKVPRYIAFVASLPYTPTLRVEKFRLRADRTLRERAIDLLEATE